MIRKAKEFVIEENHPIIHNYPYTLKRGRAWRKVQWRPPILLVDSYRVVKVVHVRRSVRIFPLWRQRPDTCGFPLERCWMLPTTCLLSGPLASLALVISLFALPFFLYFSLFSLDSFHCSAVFQICIKGKKKGFERGLADAHISRLRVLVTALQHIGSIHAVNPVKSRTLSALSRTSTTLPFH